MNRKIFWLVSLFVLSAMAIPNLGYAQDPIPGRIPVFIDEFGSEDNSVIFQTPGPNGNIGIGTTSPEAKLHVAGDFIASGATLSATRQLTDTVVFISNYANFEAAIDALNALGTDVTLIIDRPTTASASRTINKKVALTFLGAGQLSINNTVTVTINGPIQTAERQIFAGPGFVSLPNIGTVWARWFGAKGDGTPNDAPEITKAILAAQASNNATVQLGAGVFAIESTLVVAIANRAVNIMGVPASMQQGSARNVTQLRWTGGADTMLSMGVTFGEVSWITFDNYNGQATSAISYPNAGGRSNLDHVTFFSTPNMSWGTAAVVLRDVDYTTWRHIEGLAGPFLSYSGEGTDLSVESSVFEDVTQSANPWFLINGALERLIFRHVTWNISSRGVRPNSIVLRTTAMSELWIVSIEDCEFDNAPGHPPNAIWLDLNNAKIAEVARTEIDGVGNLSALIRLTNSHLTLRNNTMHSLRYLVTATDSASSVFSDQNYPYAPGNVYGIFDSAARSAQVVPVSVSAGSARLHGERISPSAHVLFRIDATDASNFDVTWAKPLDTDGGFTTAGQLFTVMIRNTTPGAMGTVTFPLTHFKTSTGGAFTSPEPRKNRSITFVNDGSYAVELWRSAADVDN